MRDLQKYKNFLLSWISLKESDSRHTLPMFTLGCVSPWVARQDRIWANAWMDEGSMSDVLQFDAGLLLGSLCSRCLWP